MLLSRTGVRCGNSQVKMINIWREEMAKGGGLHLQIQVKTCLAGWNSVKPIERHIRI